MKIKSVLAASLAALVLLVTAVPAAKAFTYVGDPIPIGTLLQGGQFTVGDKTFSSFTRQNTGSVIDSGLVVQPGYDSLGNYGFSLIGLITTNSIGDILLRYTVAAPSPLITDIHLAFNGTPISGVSETVSVGNTRVGQINVDNPGSGSAFMVFPDGPYQVLNVTKDIGFRVTQQGTFPTISYIDQTFSQTTSVPEPSTLALFGVGMGLIGLVAWRRNKLS